MAEISEREYALLMESLHANATSLSSLNTTVNALSVNLAENYVKKAEEFVQDNDLKSELYSFVRTSVNGIQRQFNVLVLGASTIIVLLIASVGWILSHPGH